MGMPRPDNKRRYGQDPRRLGEDLGDDLMASGTVILAVSQCGAVGLDWVGGAARAEQEGGGVRGVGVASRRCD